MLCIHLILFTEPGVLAFAKPSFVIKETGLKALIPIVRLGGSDGHVSVKWQTKDITAVEGKDYTGREGEIEFENQESTKNLIIRLYESNVRRLNSYCIIIMSMVYKTCLHTFRMEISQFKIIKFTI